MTVSQIIKEMEAFSKNAREKAAEDTANFDSFPGAENDNPVPSDAKKPDPEVKKEGPASERTTDGAQPGSDAKPLNDHLYEADEPVLNPAKKDMESSDANAKEASLKANAYGNKILKLATRVAFQRKQAQAAQHGRIDLNSAIFDKIANNNAATLAGQAEWFKRGQEDAKDAQLGVEDAIQGIQNASDEQLGAETAAQGIQDAANEASEGDADGAGEIQPDEAVQAIGELVNDGQLDPNQGMELLGNIIESCEDAPTSEDIGDAIAESVDNGEISQEDAQSLIGQLQGDGVSPEDAAADGFCDDGSCDNGQGQKEAEYAEAVDTVNRANAFFAGRRDYR